MLRRLHAAGKTARQMKEDLPSRPVGAIATRMTTLSLQEGDLTLTSSRAPWSAAEDAKLRTLVEQGSSMAAAWKHFPDRSLCALRSYFYSVCRPTSKGLTRTNHAGPYTESELNTAVEMYKSGVSNISIADKLGHSHMAITRLLSGTLSSDIKNNIGRTPRYKLWTAEDDTKLPKLYREGHSEPKIASLLGDRTARAVNMRIIRTLPRIKTKRLYDVGLTADALRASLLCLRSEGKRWPDILKASPSISPGTLRHHDAMAKK